MTEHARSLSSHARTSIVPWQRAAGCLLAGATSLGACGSSETVDTAPTAARVAAVEVPEMQPLSIQAQGRSLQGMTLQGTQLQGRSLAAATLQSVALQGHTLQGATLAGVRVGSTLTGTLSDGSAADLVIAGIETDSLDASGETVLYTVLYRNPVTEQMENVCPPDPYGVQKAVAVAGTWDATGARAASATTFTFGCTKGVIARCVRWGYKPWKTVGGQSMADHHQACTRMARADYCGDGVSHTLDGTWVDIYDAVGVQVKTPNSGMSFEALWSTQGATCVGKPRYYGLPLVMDPTSIPSSSCEDRVAALSLRQAARGTIEDSGPCRITPTGGQVLVANNSFVNTITP